MAVLHMQFRAVLQSWGKPEAWITHRRTFAQPTRGAILGIIACALGIDRNDEQSFSSLARKVTITPKHPGAVMRLTDNQVISIRQYARDGIALNGFPSAEGNIKRVKSAAVMSEKFYKEYIEDRLGSPLFADVESDEETIRVIAYYLQHPVYPYYLGRYCCTPCGSLIYNPNPEWDTMAKSENPFRSKSPIFEISDSYAECGKLPLVEIHILRATNGELLNRDFNGRHKTLELGGTTRSRISSASQKQAIRLDRLRKAAGKTRELSYKVYQRISAQNGLTEPYLNTLKQVIAGVVESGNPEEWFGSAEEQSEDISDALVQKVADAILKEMPKNFIPEKQPLVVKHVRGKLAKGVERETLNGDTALLGRMCTDASADDVYSAIHLNHAYSVNAVSFDVNDHSAIDDYMSRFSSRNSVAFLGTTDCWSNVYYQYASVCTRTLFESLLKGRELTDGNITWAMQTARKELETVCREVIDLMPSAMQTRMWTNATPRSVYITVGSGVAPSTLDDAFAHAIDGDSKVSVGEYAVRRLKAEMTKRHDGRNPQKYQKEIWLSEQDKAPDWITQTSFDA